MSDEQFDPKAKAVEQRAQALLRESAEQLDGATRSRLTQARHAALAAAQRKPAATRWLVPATAGAAAAVLAVVMTTQTPDIETASPEMTAQTVNEPAVDELDIITAEDSLEFYRDVEFYAWLDQELGAELGPDEKDEHEA